MAINFLTFSRVKLCACNNTPLYPVIKNFSTFLLYFISISSKFNNQKINLFMNLEKMFLERKKLGKNSNSYQKLFPT